MTRRGNALRPVNSYKNVIDTEGGLTAGINSVTDVVAAVEIQALDQTANQVPVGAKISAIFYTLYVFTDGTEATTNVANVYWWKKPSPGLSVPSPGVTTVSENKNMIFHEEKGLGGNRTNGTPMVVKGVLKLPKSMSRFSVNSKLQMVLQIPNVSGTFCSKHIYKVFY